MNGLPPGLQGYVMGQQQAQQQGAGQISQLSGMLQIQGLLQKRQQEEAYRKAVSSLGPEATQEDILKAIRPYASPDKLVGVMASAEAKKQQTQLNLMRLMESRDQFERRMQEAFRVNPDPAAKALIDQQYKQGMLNFKRYESMLHGKTTEYNVGGGMPTLPEAPVLGLNPAQSAQPAAPQPSGLQGMLAGRPPAEQAAIQAVSQAGATPMTVDVGNYQAPQAAPVSAPAPMARPVVPPLGNEDMQDRRMASMAGGVQSTAPIPTAAVTGAPPMPQMPPEIASAPQRVQNQWRLQQTRPSISGGGNLTPETVKRVAEQVLAGDERALIPWTRNQQAMATINDEITKQANAQSLTGGDIVGRRAATTANRTALVAVTKDLAAITPFKEMLDQNAKIAVDLGRKIAADKTNSAFVNKPLLWVKNNLSDRPDIAEYLAQMHFIEVEAARVLTQPRLVGQLTDQAISDMKSILSGNMTIASTEAVINRIQSDGNNRINAMRAQKSRLLSDIQGTPARTRSTDKPTADQFFR